MDDVSDIFKMYGVDYKEVSITNCVQSGISGCAKHVGAYCCGCFVLGAFVVGVLFLELLLKVYCSFFSMSLQSMVKDMDSYSERCIGKEDFFKLATVKYFLTLFEFLSFQKFPFIDHGFIHTL